MTQAKATTTAANEYNFEPDTENFLAEVLEGLSTTVQKLLPCKYLYDERGSRLFDAICELPEYYPTRTELSIMRQHSAAMAEKLGKNCLLIEYGSGSSVKIRVLLDELDEPAAYVPLDISREHLYRCAKTIADDHPGLTVIPVCADYTTDFELPTLDGPVGKRVVYFPGSTLGNFHRDDARAFLAHIRKIVGEDGGLLIGLDLRKDPSILRAAYNDRDGVTAAFNLNLLERMNRELDADFDLNHWHHEAIFNDSESRVEMHLVSDRDQAVHLGGRTFEFKKDETIRTECSYKHTLDGFRELADEAGFTVEQVWTDPDQLFSVQYLAAKP